MTQEELEPLSDEEWTHEAHCALLTRKLGKRR